GPAGIIGAVTAATLGATVALVERQPDLGGAGANTGTIPSKTLRETALALSGLRSRDLYGVDLSLRREATVPDFLRRHIAWGVVMARFDLGLNQLFEFRREVNPSWRSAQLTA